MESHYLRCERQNPSRKRRDANDEERFLMAGITSKFSVDHILTLITCDPKKNSNNFLFQRLTKTSGRLSVVMLDGWPTPTWMIAHSRPIESFDVLIELTTTWCFNTAKELMILLHFVIEPFSTMETKDHIQTTGQTSDQVENIHKISMNESWLWLIFTNITNCMIKGKTFQLSVNFLLNDSCFYK